MLKRIHQNIRFQLCDGYEKWRRDRVWGLKQKGKNNKIIVHLELKIVNNSLFCYLRQNIVDRIYEGRKKENSASNYYISFLLMFHKWNLVHS